MHDTDLDAARDVLTYMAERARQAGSGVVLARFAGFGEEDCFLVTLTADRAPIPALSTMRLAPSDLGCEVVVAFEGSDPARPVIVGRLQRSSAADAAAPMDCLVDGARVKIQARQQIELRCGDASIVLTQAGKVLIKGNFVLSRSRGANKIKGAHVAIN